jgi:hypothetical protein
VGATFPSIRDANGNFVNLKTHEIKFLEPVSWRFLIEVGCAYVCVHMRDCMCVFVSVCAIARHGRSWEAAFTGGYAIPTPPGHLRSAVPKGPQLSHIQRRRRQKAPVAMHLFGRTCAPGTAPMSRLLAKHTRRRGRRRPKVHAPQIDQHPLAIQLSP